MCLSPPLPCMPPSSNRALFIPDNTGGDNKHRLPWKTPWALAQGVLVMLKSRDLVLGYSAPCATGSLWVPWVGWVSCIWVTLWGHSKKKGTQSRFVPLQLYITQNGANDHIDTLQIYKHFYSGAQRDHTNRKTVVASNWGHYIFLPIFPAFCNMTFIILIKTLKRV